MFALKKKLAKLSLSVKVGAACGGLAGVVLGVGAIPQALKSSYDYALQNFEGLSLLTSGLPMGIAAVTTNIVMYGMAGAATGATCVMVAEKALATYRRKIANTIQVQSPLTVPSIPPQNTSGTLRKRHSAAPSPSVTPQPTVNLGLRASSPVPAVDLTARPSLIRQYQKTPQTTPGSSVPTTPQALEGVEGAAPVAGIESASRLRATPQFIL